MRTIDAPFLKRFVEAQDGKIDRQEAESILAQLKEQKKTDAQAKSDYGEMRSLIKQGLWEENAIVALQGSSAVRLCGVPTPNGIGVMRCADGEQGQLFLREDVTAESCLEPTPSGRLFVQYDVPQGTELLYARLVDSPDMDSSYIGLLDASGRTYCFGNEEANSLDQLSTEN